MALTQSHYRFGIVEPDQSSHGWYAAEDTNVNRVAGANGQFLLRFCVQADATGLNNVDFEFQRRHSRGGSVISDWANINATSSTVVRTGTNNVFVNGQDTTKRLSGTGTFVTNNDGCTTDGTTGGNNNDIPANGNSECEIGLQILSADTQAGDLIEFRLTRDGGTLLNTYAVTPAVTVAAEIFPVANRDPGSVTSNPQTVPSGASGKKYAVLTDIPQADLDDTSVQFSLSMETQDPDLSWRFNAGITFVGGPNQGKGGTATKAPGWTQDGSEVAGKSVRFTLNNTGVAFDAGLIAVPLVGS